MVLRSGWLIEILVKRAQNFPKIGTPYFLLIKTLTRFARSCFNQKIGSLKAPNLDYNNNYYARLTEN